MECDGKGWKADSTSSVTEGLYVVGLLTFCRTALVEPVTDEEFSVIRPHEETAKRGNSAQEEQASAVRCGV